ncbi:molybdopterin-binding protein [Celerinatantimonas sp. MCCC 1A17872]|uniref:TOBE domain-containing protein n=1 Tax=Celerinatantimonas sp. MCCC 1A17872 TaxID=3177514 RepID=UPI0038C58775
MKLSARNQFKGIVKSITTGAVNSEVHIELADGLVISSIITNGAVENLGLTVGQPAFAVIKATDVLIGIE